MPLIGQLPPGLLSGAANTVQANQGFGGAAGGGMVGGGILQLLAQLAGQQPGGAPLPAAVDPNPELTGTNPAFVPDPGLAPPGLLAPGTVPGDVVPGPPEGFPGFGGEGALPFLPFPGFGQQGAQGGSFGGFGGFGGLPGGFQRFDTGGTEPTIASGGPQFRRPGGPQGPGQIPAV